MDSDEYSTSRVPPERSIAWWKIATINVLFSVSLPTLITGMDLANESSQAVFLSSILVGSVILTVIGILTSIVGCRARFSSYMLARIAFGARGSMLLNLAFALSLIGWFGVNLNLFGDSIQRLLEAQLNYHGPEWPSELGAGFLITGTTLVGLKAINRLSMLIVPVLLFVCALLLVKSLTHESAADLLARAPATGYSGSATGYKTTPKGVISYEIGKTMIYASAAEGFRDGGINRSVPIPLCSPDLATLGLTQAPPSYKADSLWSYELGAKSRPLSDRLSVSGSLFDIRWSNIQTDIILPTCTFDIKDNIGSAENRGVEFETTALAAEDLKINLSGNFTDARITAPVTILGVERGDHVPGVPRYQFSTAIDYTHPLAENLRGRWDLNGQWVGPSQGTIIHTDPDFSRPAYFVMSGNVGMQWQRFDLSLFVTNLLDQHKVLQRPNIALVEYGVTVRPRTIGLAGNYSF